MTAPKKPKRPTRPREKPVAELRPTILLMLGDGYTVSAIARECKCARRTVRLVRDDPDAQVQLAAKRKARVAEHEARIEDGRRILQEGVTAAAHALVDATQHADPRVRVRAARELLDRVGIPRVEEVHHSGDEAEVDLSLLSDEEFDQFRALRAKAKVKRL